MAWTGRQSIILAAGVAAILIGCDKPASPPSSATQPATKPTTRPTTVSATVAPIAPPPPPADVLDVLKLDNPAYANKTPLDLPADFADAAKIILDRPAYVDPMGNLWLTHPAGQTITQALLKPVKNHTIVTREEVTFASWPDNGGPGSAIVRNLFRVRPRTADSAAVKNSSTHPELQALPQTLSGEPAFEADTVLEFAGSDVAAAQFLSNGDVIIPCILSDNRGSGVIRVSKNLSTRFIPLPQSADGKTCSIKPALAPAGDGVWAWGPNNWAPPGSGGAIYITATGEQVYAPSTGFPDRPIEVIPLADGSVLVVAVDGSADDASPGKSTVLKLISAAEKPPTLDQLRTIRPLAMQLGDIDPVKREAAQRALEAQGPSAFPILESLREQLSPEAQVRIETLLGQRFSPTLGGLRPLEGKCRTLARFPGGGCVLRFDGGGTVGGAMDDEPERSVIPATVLIRPGRTIQLIDPEAATDFVAGKQSIQSVAGELFINDSTTGPRRWVGMTLLPPMLPKSLADFDTIMAVDARKRWLLTSAKRPGKTLLIDPTLPDATPALPVWNVAAQNGVGWTDAGWPAVRRGDRLFILERDGWRTDKVDLLRETWVDLPAIVDKAGREYVIDGRTIHITSAAGLTADIKLPEDAPAETSDDIRLATSPGRLFVYTSDGKVRRYAVTSSDGGLKATLESTFTAGVPRNATRLWIDPAGRLVMAGNGGLAIGFPDGRVPAALRDLIMRVER